MELAKLLGSNKTPWVRKYQAGETFALAGVPALVGGAGDYGLKKCTTTAAASFIGLTLDTATVVTAQQSDNSDTARSLSLIVNPDILIRARLSGGATSGTALTEGTEATGSSNGLLVDTEVDYSSPSLDEGALLCSAGANKGVVRPVTSLSTANAVMILSFPRDIAIGDKFIALPWKFSSIPGAGVPAHAKQFVQLTSTLDQVDASVTIDTDNANFIPVELEMPADDSFTTKINVLMVPYDHLYAAGAQ